MAKAQGGKAQGAKAAAKKRVVKVDSHGDAHIVASFNNIIISLTNKQGQVREAEEGLMGVSLDPKFATNRWIYLYYAHDYAHGYSIMNF